MARPVDLSHRLRSSSHRHAVQEPARSAHLLAIQAELRGPVVPIRSGLVPARRSWVAAAAVAAMIAGSAAISLIAIDAVPGDGLYSTKRAVERAIAVFDGDVIAEHRVGELESLIARREGPAIIRAAQLEASAALVRLSADHPLHQMLRRLVIGSAPLPYHYDQAVDWHGGETFDTSLPDGNLLHINHLGGEESVTTVELTVTGHWFLAGGSGQWQLSDQPPDDLTAEATVFTIRVDPSGLSITLRGDGSSSSSFDRLSDAIRESRADDGVNPAGPEATTTTTIPEIGAPASGSGNDSTSGNPASTTLTTTVSPTTAAPTDPPTKPTTTTTSSSTTTTKVVTTTRPTTTTTTQPTTTTTQPTTTTTSDDDDDDDDDDD